MKLSKSNKHLRIIFNNKIILTWEILFPWSNMSARCPPGSSCIQQNEYTFISSYKNIKHYKSMWIGGKPDHKLKTEQNLSFFPKA